ncbi:DEKNAAC105242 [Brettanomyces naardenensis]|uniref:DEKNAAC105242 n=1 Tax=Brettanomyces naardenensis TaxID=13370 RepID=A0A448YSN9_BRENA|nr:DEKNAAC105242 [Brettanomyces naardenensis]
MLLTRLIGVNGRRILRVEGIHSYRSISIRQIPGRIETSTTGKSTGRITGNFDGRYLSRRHFTTLRRPSIAITAFSRSGKDFDAHRFVGLPQRRSISFSDVLTRIRWTLKKSKRPFNTDDFSAFFSWLLAGNIVLLIVGTTTFFSLLLYTLNTVLAQELVAEWVGNLITKNTNLTVTFENAIVPDWKDGKIQFKNCTVSRRPRNKEMFKKKRSEKSTGLWQMRPWKRKKDQEKSKEYDDGNYTQFDLTIQEMNISLSFKKWLNGRGILKEVSGKGVRGVVDRTHVHWKEGDSATNYKNVSRPGDWEIENLKMEDVLFTMLNANGFRSFAVSIYNFEVPLLRKNWLMFDILNSKHMSGSYDGSLFTMNRLQRLDNFNEEKKIDREVNAHLGRDKYKRLDLMNDENFSKVTRFRIDNLKVDHLNGGMSGPFGWINKGTVDLIADVIVPKKNASTKEFSIDEMVRYYSRNLRGEESIPEKSLSDMGNLFIMDFYLRLNNPRATIPLFSSDLSYVNNALIRPIVAYINSNKTFIPIRCRVYKDVADFDGSWTLYDSLLMDDLSVGVYEGFADYVADEEHRSDRVKKVGFWSLQFVLQLILWSLSTLNG